MAPRFLAPTAGMLVCVLLAAAPPATAKGGGDGGQSEARVSGTCSAGATSSMRLRSRDGQIRVDFELERRRGGEAWRFVIVHERRVEWRTVAHTRGSNNALEVRHTVADLDGPDEVTLLASGPRGMTCEAAATLLG